MLESENEEEKTTQRSTGSRGPTAPPSAALDPEKHRVPRPHSTAARALDPASRKVGVRVDLPVVSVSRLRLFLDFVRTASMGAILVCSCHCSVCHLATGPVWATGSRAARRLKTRVEAMNAQVINCASCKEGATELGQEAVWVQKRQWQAEQVLADVICFNCLGDVSK